MIFAREQAIEAKHLKYTYPIKLTTTTTGKIYKNNFNGIHKRRTNCHEQVTRKERHKRANECGRSIASVRQLRVAK